MKNSFQRLTNPGRALQMASKSLAWTVMVTAALLNMQSADAQTYKVLHFFTGNADGNSPGGKLVRIGETLYGTQTRAALLAMAWFSN
jgi:hypothetical protein